MAAVHVRFHEEDARATSRGDDARRAFRVGRDRLLAKDVLVRRDASERLRFVRRVRRRDVHGVDVAVREQLLERFRRRSDAPTIGKSAGLRHGRSRDVDDAAPLRSAKRRREVARDRAGPHDAPSQRRAHDLESSMA
jgi:hypothetical protein